jgi:hypothetical protein
MSPEIPEKQSKYSTLDIYERRRRTGVVKVAGDIQ